MFIKKRRVPSQRTAKLIATAARISTCHFKSEAKKRKALEQLTPEQCVQAESPLRLAALVKANVVPENFVNRVLIKLGGMSRQRPPRDVTVKKVVPVILGKPFLATDDGPTRMAVIAQHHPSGFRTPSSKAKKWCSTSLVEKVMGIAPTPTRSARGLQKAQTDAETRELVRATQDVRNIPNGYLSAAQRRMKASLPKLPKDQTLSAIRERHIKARLDADEDNRIAA